MLLFVPAQHAADPPPPKREDVKKRVVEAPVEKLVLTPKKKIERPVENLTATKTASSDFVNPKVEPGKVKWHADFASACQAARKSGKPVLLFQMMGKLDDQFC
jgi:hypothetical protein